MTPNPHPPETTPTSDKPLTIEEVRSVREWLGHFGAVETVPMSTAQLRRLLDYLDPPIRNTSYGCLDAASSLEGLR